jgi:hypothetical protein
LKGVVGYVSSNDWDDRRTGEKIKLWSFKVEGDNTWYRTGQKEPAFKKGQSIQFDVKDAKGNVDFDSIEVLESEVKVAPKPAASGRSASGSAGSRDDYWANKEQRDLAKDERYQTVDIPRMTFCTSQDAAVALVTAAIEKDILPIPKDSAKSARLKGVLNMVDELTDRFFKQRMAASTEGKVEKEEQAEPASKEKTLDD